MAGRIGLLLYSSIRQSVKSSCEMALMLLLAPAALLLPRAAVPPRAQQHRSSARFLLCAQPQPDLEPNVAEALKAEFRLRAARGNRGLSLRPDEVKGLQDLAERLESINPTPCN